MVVVSISQSKKTLFMSLYIVAVFLVQVWAMGSILPIHLLDNCSEHIFLSINI